MARDNKIFSLLAEHTNWRMNECLNLIPSENVTSHEVRELLASDLGHRYTLHLNMKMHIVALNLLMQLRQKQRELPKRSSTQNSAP